MEAHTNFKLNGGGEYLGLFKPDAAKAVSEFSPAYPMLQRQDISFGHGAGLQFFDKPTPGRTKAASAALSEEPRIFRQAVCSLRRRRARPLHARRQQTDSNQGQRQSRSPSKRPPHCERRHSSRACAPATSYLFAEHIAPPARPAGFPAKWNGHSADYEMDPDVVNDPKYKGRVANALKSIPTLSLVLNRDDFFKTGQGSIQSRRREGHLDGADPETGESMARCRPASTRR